MTDIINGQFRPENGELDEDDDVTVAVDRRGNPLRFQAEQSIALAFLLRGTKGVERYLEVSSEPRDKRS